MQIMLILGIGFAIAAVMFALQNNLPVTVAFAIWRFEGSLAVVLLLALGLGAVIAGLVSSPAVIKGQWLTSRLRRQVSDLESEKMALEQRVAALSAELAKLDPAPPEEPKPYVGLTDLITRR